MSDSPPPGSPPPPPPGGGQPPSPPPGSGDQGGGGFTAGGGAGQSSGGLDIGAAFRFGWETFQANVGPLVIGILVLFVGIFAISFVWQLLVGGLVGTTEGDAIGIGGAIAGLSVFAIGSFVSIVGQYIVQAVIVRAGFDLVDGRGIDTARLFDTDNLGAIIITGLLVSLGTTVGLILCIIPGIIFAIIAGYSFHFVIDEGKAPVDAIRASIDLYRDQPGSALLLWLVTSIVSGLGALLCGVGLLVTFPVALIAQAHGFRQLRGRAPQVA